MKKILFLQYPKCSTCQKAGKWLKDNGIDVENRNIAEQNPNKEELTSWIRKSGLPISKFFNTSGKIYKEQNLKERVKSSTEDELISLLASNGMLAKRPIIVCDDGIVIIGFNEEQWTKLLK